MTTYCRYCSETFHGLMGNDLNEERSMLVDHYAEEHGIPDPILHSFTRSEVEAECMKAGTHIQGRPF